VGVARYFRFAALGLAFALLASTANADELKRLYAQILRDPTNSELNFRYAALAEQRGEIRKALSAYERILVNDPNNPEVRKALQRIRRKLQPNTTQFFAELGAAYESNPRRVEFNEKSDGVALARLTIRDERGIGNDGMRWRTIGQLSGDIQFKDSDLNYGYAGGYTGPVIDLTPTIALHAAAGGGTSYFDHQHFFSEAFANLTFESYLEGAYQTVRVRAGYREYNDFFPSQDGLYADVVGKFSFPNVLGPGDVFIATPWYRYSDFAGSGFSLLAPTEQVQPGRYSEFGGRLEYYKRILEWVTVGGGIAASKRSYADSRDVFFPFFVTKRDDVLIMPTATVIFHNVAGYQTDLKLEYRYEHNDSNVLFRSYENHIATMMLQARF
jgi:hypothetical protein